MTTELTKAAQRVLDAYDALDKLDSFIKLAHEMAALRALTQRPAAQTEREAFEEWYAEDANKQTGKPGWFTPKSIAELRDGDGYGEHRVMLNGKWEGWQARASLPAPQQATPEPAGEPVARVELMQTGGNAGLATRIVEIDDPLRERLRPGGLLFTRPAPGVPEGVLADMQQFAKAGAGEYLGPNHMALVLKQKINEWVDALAAAQAKGGVHE